MFGSVGAPELILIFIVALLVFGPRKLPELGRAIGKGISEFRKATSDLKTTLEREMAAEEAPGPTRSLPSEAPPEPPPNSGALDGGDGDRTPR